jgi:hypothetical protein
MEQENIKPELYIQALRQMLAEKDDQIAKLSAMATQYKQELEAAKNEEESKNTDPKD